MQEYTFQVAVGIGEEAHFMHGNKPCVAPVFTITHTIRYDPNTTFKPCTIYGFGSGPWPSTLHEGAVFASRDALLDSLR